MQDEKEKDEDGEERRPSEAPFALKDTRWQVRTGATNRQQTNAFRNHNR